MIGSSDLTIYGILQDGSKELVFENGIGHNNSFKLGIGEIKYVKFSS